MTAQAAKKGIAASEVEMILRGKVFLGRHQNLYNASQKDPSEADVMLEDSRGRHTGWFILALGMAEGKVRWAWEERLDGDPRARP